MWLYNIEGELLDNTEIVEETNKMLFETFDIFLHDESNYYKCRDLCIYYENMDDKSKEIYENFLWKKIKIYRNNISILTVAVHSTDRHRIFNMLNEYNIRTLTLLDNSIVRNVAVIVGSIISRLIRDNNNVKFIIYVYNVNETKHIFDNISGLGYDSPYIELRNYLDIEYYDKKEYDMILEDID